MKDDRRREIPAIDRLLASKPFSGLLDAAPRGTVVQLLGQVQAEVRAAIAAGESVPQELGDAGWYAERTARLLDNLQRPSLRPVINATGVVLHTNLGRAPLAARALAAMAAVGRGYANLEYDLGRGRRGSRYDHCSRLLCRLTGSDAALVVNNNAAALVLALNTLAEGREAVISRGELVEIGGSFRIPEIMARSGALMVEVGATNRTHLSDYREAVTSATGVILKVHQSNFRISGYTAEAGLAELGALAIEAGVPLVNDLGSGLLIPPERLGLPHEPMPEEALRAGAQLVTMSGDKLLGGPQAGIILGSAALIRRLRENPLCRALRVDKFTLAALEATLILYLDPEVAVREVPTLRMLATTASELEARTGPFVDRLRDEGIAGEVVPGTSTVGGGAFPGAALPTFLIRIGDDRPASVLERRLRATDPAVIVRVMEDRLTLDLRTVDPAEEAALATAIGRALRP